jgi:hypothetical protein
MYLFHEKALIKFRMDGPRLGANVWIRQISVAVFSIGFVSIFNHRSGLIQTI